MKRLLSSPPFKYYDKKDFLDFIDGKEVPRYVLYDLVELFAKHGNLRGLKLMESKGMTKGDDLRDSLIRASNNGYLNIVKYLIEEQGVDPHAYNDVSILWAVKNGHLNIVKYLIEEQGVDPQVRNNEALEIAKREKHYDIVSYLESLP